MKTQIEKKKIEYGYSFLPDRFEVKPVGKYIIPPAFKYNLWDFIKDIIFIAFNRSKGK